MPGKHLEFVKSGRYVVPVEISFLPTAYKDSISGKEVFTSKWAVRSHWKEIKALLKPAIDTCSHTSTGGFSTSPHISYGQEVGLGYVLCVDSTKDKSPFIAVLDSKKNCWTDDEDDFDELDELCAGLRDYGGSHRSHVPTKIFVKAAVIKKTTSTVNDSKKLKKELGFKVEDLRSYFQNTSPSGSSSTLVSSLHDKDWIDGRSKRFGFGTLGGGDTGMDEIGPFNLPRRWANSTERAPGARARVPGSGGNYYEEQDDDEDSDDVYKEVDLFNDNNIETSDDDNFSLPDIDAPQADIQMKQLKKETAKKEKQKLQNKGGVPGRLHRPHKQERPARLASELWEPRKTIQLVNPASDQFAQKLGSVLPLTSPLKTSSNIAAGKSKKLSTKQSSTGTGSTKKLKECKVSTEKESSKLPTASSAESTEELENIPENFLGSSTKQTQSKKVRKRKYIEEGTSTAVEEEPETSNPIPEESAKSKKSSKTPSAQLRHANQRQDQDEAGTAVSTYQSNGPHEESQPSDTESKEKGSKKKKKTKKKRRDTTPPPSAVEEEHEVEIPVKKAKKRRDAATAPLAPSTVEEEIQVEFAVKKAKKRRDTAPPLVKVKMEKSSPTVIPCTFDSKDLGIFDEAELRGLEVDPEMPILSPEVVNGEEPGQPEEAPVTKRAQKLPKKKKKAAITLPPKKTKKSRSEKSAASTQTGENDKEETMGNRDESQAFAPVDMEEEARQKLTENFMQDDENVGDGMLSPPAHQFLQPASMMPPPSRPAPRTPKKDQRLSQLRPTERGFTQNPMGSQDVTDPSKLSTIQLMCNPRILRAGVGLLNNLSRKKMSAVEIGSRMGFKDLSKDRRRVRELSPDITSFPNEQKIERDNDDGSPVVSRNEERRDKSQSDEELSDNDQQEEGESLIRELLDRVHANSKNDDAYEPEGDGYDLSQKSMCFLNIIPGYSQKSRSFKIHCKKVTDLTFEKLMEHYIGVRPALRQIFEGEVANIRSNTYLQGPVGIKRLQEMSVSIPFDHDQTSSIITLLLEYFIPDTSQRPKWSDYISYVLLPEALINIYARVNEIPYKMAEKEMRFQGCYDDTS